MEAGREDGEGGIQRRWRGDEPDGTPHRHHHGEALRSGLEDAGERLGLTHAKHRPRVAGGGDNLPLEIVQSLSVWLSVLDARGVVPGMTPICARSSVWANGTDAGCRERAGRDVRVLVEYGRQPIDA